MYSNSQSSSSTWTLIVVMGLIVISAWLYSAHPSLSSLSVFSTSSSDSVQSAPHLTAKQVDSVLCSNGSPACRTGEALYQDSVSSGIDDAYALGVFKAESQYGRLGWAYTNHSIGNIRCSAGYDCNGGYRYYATWEAGYADWFSLIKKQYIEAWGLTTVQAIAQKYAPSSENDTNSYSNMISTTMKQLEGK